MTIRRATEADQAALRELWEDFEREVPEPPGFTPETWDEEWADTRQDIAEGAVYVAFDDEAAVGVARATAPERGRAHVSLVHVTRRARRQGIAKALLLECVRELRAKGATLVSLDVLVSNNAARGVWRRLGFEDIEILMAAPLDALERRLAEAPSGENRAATYVQTDDRPSVDRALAQFIPRLESPDVREASNGWIRIADRVNDQDGAARARLARELSERLGAIVVALAVEQGAVVRFQLFERGRMVDEYLSVPSFYGELPKGDELALSANPTLVSRLTGADREAVRQVARNAASTAELPPPGELYERLAQVMGLEP